MSTPRLAALMPLVAALATLVAATPAAAQFCWRGRPLPDCRTFLVTESGLYFGSELGVQADLGLMVNMGSHVAVGGSLHGMYGEDFDSNWGVAGVAWRFRYWLNRRWSLDLTPRVQWIEPNEAGRWYGPTAGASIALGWADYLAVDLAIDSYEGLDTKFCLGLRLGSYLGAPGAAILGALGIGELSN